MKSRWLSYACTASDSQRGVTSPNATGSESRGGMSAATTYRISESGTTLSAGMPVSIENWRSISARLRSWLSLSVGPGISRHARVDSARSGKCLLNPGRRTLR